MLSHQVKQLHFLLEQLLPDDVIHSYGKKTPAGQATPPAIPAIFILS